MNRSLIEAMIVLLGLALMGEGCTGREEKLDPVWAPLASVRETTDKLLKSGITTTLGDTCYVGDFARFLRDYPPGSVEREALLRHERTHAVRQAQMGLSLWLARYVESSDFRWAEEQEGWRQEIAWLTWNARTINSFEIARLLNQDYDFHGRMVSYEDALKFVNAAWKAAADHARTGNGGVLEPAPPFGQ